jgi:hypothetical protein
VRREGEDPAADAFKRSTQLSRALGANAFRGCTLHRPTPLRRARRRSAPAPWLHVSPSPRPQRRRRAPHATTRASAARCSQGAASQRPAPRLPPRPPPCSLARGSRRRAPTSQGMLISVGPRSAESEANCLASATSGMSGAARATRALRLVVDGCCIGAARFPLAPPRALAFGSRAAAPRTCGRAIARAPCRRRCAPRPGASALPPRSPGAARRPRLHARAAPRLRAPRRRRRGSRRHHPPSRFAAHASLASFASRFLAGRLRAHSARIPCANIQHRNRLIGRLAGRDLVRCDTPPV